MTDYELILSNTLAAALETPHSETEECKYATCGMIKIETVSGT